MYKVEMRAKHSVDGFVLVFLFFGVTKTKDDSVIVTRNSETSQLMRKEYQMPIQQEPKFFQQNLFILSNKRTLQVNFSST